jgi:hypothetical protein
VNAALLAPAGTGTLPGTVTLELLLPSVTPNPPAGAAPLRVTVQLAVPGALTLTGTQDKPLSVTVGRGWLIVIVPPVPVIGIENPEAFDAMAALIEICALVAVVPAAIVKEAMATGPLPIGVVLVP